MRINMLFVPIALFGIVGCSASDSDTIDSDDDASPRAQLSATLQADVDVNHREGVVGVIAEVSDGTETIQARAGESRLGSGTPIPIEAKFRMGSNTKTFVAVVVLQLAEEGKLSLDDSVERWLPGVVSANGNDGARITMSRAQHSRTVGRARARSSDPDLPTPHSLGYNLLAEERSVGGGDPVQSHLG